MYSLIRLVRAATLAACVGACLLSPAALAQTAPVELRVATRVLPPMVIERGTGLDGFSIDLWNALAVRLGVQTV